jgi:hypothetical protein
MTDIASLAVPWITPPPPFDEVLKKHSGRAIAFATQSMTIVSSSVHAGEQSQLKAGALKAAEYISPRMLGYVTVEGKKAMNLGDCQCVNPGLILDATSF